MFRKKAVPAVIISFLLLSALLSAQDIPKPMGYVSDFAEVLSPETEKSLNGKIQSYKDTTGIEVAVVTVPSLQGYEIDQFTIKLAQNWGVGQKEKDNGVVFLLAPKEREVRIEVGYGLEGDLTDGRSGQILDQVAVPYFKKEDWSGGINATVDELLSYLGQQTYQARLAEKEQIRQTQLQKQREFNASLSLFFTVAIPMVLVVILIVVIHAWHKHRKVLQQIKKTNSNAIYEVVKKFKHLELLSTAAEEGVMRKLNKDKVNFDSVKTQYVAMMQEIKSVVDTSQETISTLKSQNEELKQAEKVSDIIDRLNKALEEMIRKANTIIALPNLLLSKKSWTRVAVQMISPEVKRTSLRVNSELSKLDKEFEGKIIPLLQEASENVARVTTAIPADKNNRPNNDWNSDWLYLAEQLNVADKNAKQINALIDEYLGLVEKAQAEKPSLLFKLETERARAGKATDVADVKTSTKTTYIQALAKIQPVRQLCPEKEQEWVSFLKRVSGLIEEFEKITARAKMDVREAEDARQARIRASQRSSHSSSSRSSGFGGGGFGGGGASRRF